MSSEVIEIYVPESVVEVTSPVTSVLEIVDRGLQGIQGDPGEPGEPGEPGLEGPPGGGLADSFETAAQNLTDLNVIATSFTEGVILTKTFDSGAGTTIVMTLLFDGQGLPATKTLSGTGLPPGINTVCTYDFTGRTIPLKTYS